MSDAPLFEHQFHFQHSFGLALPNPTTITCQIKRSRGRAANELEPVRSALGVRSGERLQLNSFIMPPLVKSVATL